ncbi:MAG: hypothetical protein R3D98_11100 [Candidatus Krumholzibacteriia bacterium]
MPHRRPIRPLLAASLAALALVAGCEEFGALPGEPANGGADSAWNAVFPDDPYVDARCMFALDVDDVWVGGDEGQLAHFDGRSFAREALPAPYAVSEIHGCRSDEVWARASRRFFRWDGRSWRFEFEFDSWTYDASVDEIWNDAPGSLYLAGRDYGLRRAFVERHDREGTKRWYLGAIDADIDRLWRPAPELPLMALIDDRPDSLFAFDGESWRPLPFAGNLRAVAGRLLAVSQPEHIIRETLYRLGRDGGLELVCPDFDLYTDELIDCREPLLFHFGDILALRACQRIPVGMYETDSWFGGLGPACVPRRAGPDAGSFFRITPARQLERFTWQSTDVLVGTEFALNSELVPTGDLVVTDEAIFAIDHASRLLVGTDAGWAHEDQDGRWLDDLTLLVDGSVLARMADPATSEEFAARRFADGRWQITPALVAGQHTWIGCDAVSGTFYAMTENGEFARSDGGAWSIRDELGGRCSWYGMARADRQFARIRLADEELRLLAFDGETWRDVTPADVDYFETPFAAPWSGRLIAYGESYGDSWERFTLIFDGQSWQRIADGRPHFEYQETPAGEVYALRGDRIEWLHPHGWKAILDASEDARYPGNGLRCFWSHPDRGLHVIDRRYQILHRADPLR